MIGIAYKSHPFKTAQNIQRKNIALAFGACCSYNILFIYEFLKKIVCLKEIIYLIQIFGVYPI